MTDQEKIADLESRLKDSYKVDREMNNQELNKFKHDLSRNLKLEYLDFLKLQQKEVDLPYYKAAIWTMEEVFNTLTKMGIELVGE
jgi:hypothetical protein